MSVGTEISPFGGQGGGLFSGGHDRADARMVGTAMRQRWPISDAIRVKLADRLSGIVLDSEDDRTVVAAAKALIDADKLNLEQEKRDSAEATGPIKVTVEYVDKPPTAPSSSMPEGDPQ